MTSIPIDRMIIGRIEDSNTAFQYQATVTVYMPNKLWQEYRKRGQLGFLYGVDISNAVFSRSEGKIKAYNPAVNDRNRASKGTKRIELTYYWNEREYKHA